MASTDRIKIEVGFAGGQSITAQVVAEVATELEHKVSSGEDGAYALEADDSRYLVVLSRIVYVKRFARESRLGFGNS